MKLQNYDIITFLNILQDYNEHLLRYLFTKIINKTSIFITFSAVLIGNFIYCEETMFFSLMTNCRHVLKLD